MDGTVYLICFERKIGNPDNPRGQAQHYIGWTEGDVLDRVAEHLAGRGAKIMAAVAREGIPIRISRLWGSVDRNFERQLKNRKNAKKLCDCG